MRDDKSVVEVATPHRVAEVEAMLNGDSITMTLNEMSGVPRQALNAPVLTEGRLPQTPGEITIDAGIAREERVSVGDAAVVRSDNATLTLEVVGLAYDFSDCFYPSCDPGRAWALGDVVASAGATHSQIAVDVADDADPDAVARAVDVARPGAVAGWNSWPDTREDMLIETKYFGAFLGAFGLFVLGRRSPNTNGRLRPGQGGRRTAVLGAGPSR